MPRQPVDPALHTPAMKAAVHRLQKENIGHDVMTHYQIKVDDHSFYPGRGTIYCDGDPKALRESGLDAFISIVRGQEKGGASAIMIPYPPKT